MKPKYLQPRFRNLSLATTVTTVLFVCLSGTSHASDWTGTTSNDWNTATNWSLGSVPTDNVYIRNIATNVPLISAPIAKTPVDIEVGTGAFTGRLDHSAGTASTGNGNWMLVGARNASANGTYNLADANGSGGTFTGMGQGSGTMTVGGGGTGGRLYVGGDDGGADRGTGVVNVNTSGSLIIRNDLLVGNEQGNGTLNLDSGTVTSGSVANNAWTFIGRSSGTGAFNMSGGSYAAYGSVRIGDGGTSNGTLTISGGTFTKYIGSNNNAFIVANGGSSRGTVNQSGGTVNVAEQELWVGQGSATASGTYNFSAGELKVGSWVAVGRDGGTGVVNMTGGTWTKTGAGTAFIIGASGPGTLNQSGGLVDVQGDTWMGEGGACNFTLSGSAEFKAGFFQVARNGSSTGNVNLNGGTLRLNQLVGGSGTENVVFNGTQIIGRVAQTNFIGSLATADIQAGGLLVDSNGLDLVSNQSFTGTGGVVKTGAGKLSLLGFNSYAGSNVVTTGELVLGSSAAGTGDITVADGAKLGVAASISVGDQLETANLSFASATLGNALNLNVGNALGLNPAEAILKVSGNLSLNGNVVVNVSGSQLQATVLPLVTYTPGTRSGAGQFTLGTLPNGVIATLVDDTVNGLVSLNITSVALPEWDGTNEVLVSTTGDTVLDSADVTVTSTTGVLVGQAVRGDGIAAGTTVTAINGNVVTLSAPVTATGTAAKIAFVATAGTNEGLWDGTTENWIDQVSLKSSVYANPNPVLFSDNATGPTAVVLNSTVSPSDVAFTSDTKAYSLSGTGKISGATALTKTNAGALTINLEGNDYTGATTFAGGPVTITKLANAGVASSIGAASADPSKLVLAATTLNYTGPAVSTDRGFTINGNDTTLNHASDITVGGQVVTTTGNLIKTGPGSLTIANGADNVLARDNRVSKIDGGTLVLDGSSGTQTNSVFGELWIGNTPNVPAGLVLNNTKLTTTNWLTLGPGNGDTGTLTSITATNSVMTTVNFSTGYDAGRPNDSDQIVTLTDTAWTNNGATQLSESANSTTTFTVAGNSSFTSSAQLLMGIGTGSVCNMTIQDSGSVTKTGGWLAIGNSNNGVATVVVKDSGKLVSTGGDFNIGDVGTSTGYLYIQGGGSVSTAGIAFIGKNTGTTGSLIMNSGSFTGSDWVSVGRYANATGTVTVEGGTFTQSRADRLMIVGEDGKGTLNVSGTGSVVSNGSLSVGHQPTANGTVNLDGGTLTTSRVYSGNAASVSSFNFNGGTLKAGENSNTDFLNGLDQVLVKSGGAFIDTNGRTIAIGQALDDDGGDLTKLGEGTLLLNGANSYFGTTTVSAGTLGGTGSLTGPLVVATGATVNPGATVGTLTAGDSATINGSFVCDIDGGAADQLAVAGALTVAAGSVLDFNVAGEPTAASYVVASFSSLTGSFTVQDVPAGYEVVTGATTITLVRTATPFGTWASGYFGNETDPNIVGPGADPDGDGLANAVEFALGSAPNNGSSSANIRSSVADGNQGKELKMTIAVRSGTPVFAGSPSPTATVDGVTYTIQGSASLGTFDAAVTPVANPTGLPDAPAGYEYRSFSLDNTGAKGFLRVQVGY